MQRAVPSTIDRARTMCPSFVVIDQRPRTSSQSQRSTCEPKRMCGVMPCFSAVRRR